MDQSEFEQQVLRVWSATRIPLTRANLLLLTRLPRGKLDRWLDEMAAAGLLDPVEEEGDLAWQVRGAARPSDGPRTVAEAERLDRLTRDVSRPGPLVLSQMRGVTTRPGGDRKSLAVSGILSFFFGPLGWLYAAPFGEAVAAILVVLIAGAVLPAVLLKPFAGLLGILSAAIGVAYAAKFNATGERTSLVTTVRHELPPRR